MEKKKDDKITVNEVCSVEVKCVHLVIVFVMCTHVYMCTTQKGSKNRMKTNK